jgi:hypothetical protein
MQFSMVFRRIHYKLLRRSRCYLGSGVWITWIFLLVFFMSGLKILEIVLCANGCFWFLYDVGFFVALMCVCFC